MQRRNGCKQLQIDSFSRERKREIVMIGHVAFCKYCGKPVEQAIEGELICSRCWNRSQMSAEEQAESDEIEWMMTHCNDNDCKVVLKFPDEKESLFCRKHQIEEDLL